jgi:vesicle transport protein SEC22
MKTVQNKLLSLQNIHFKVLLYTVNPRLCCWFIFLFFLHHLSSVAKLSIETSNRKAFHYLIRDGICFLTLTDASYPKRLIFLYLDETADGFVEELTKDYGPTEWRAAVETAARPYAFIKYDPYIQRKEREYADPSSRRNATKINEDLADIQSIMRKNIEQVLNRGEKLEHVSQISGDLVGKSKQFKWGAKKLRFRAMLNQYGPVVIGTLFVLFVLYLKFRW